MKNLYTLLILLLSPIFIYSQNTWIPDDIFEQALIDLGYDIGPLNDSVPTANIASITSLNVNSKNIQSLVGIKDFVALTRLSCNYNDLSLLDISQNLNLQSVGCSANDLVSINLPASPNLETVFASNNDLTSIDVTQNINLKTFSFSNNNVTSIDISQNPDLNYFICSNNSLNTLDVSNNPLLRTFSAGFNNLSVLDVSQNPKLSLLYCQDNNLSTLDVSQNPDLYFLWCSGNSLSALNVTQNPILERLVCHNNQLNSLDISQNPILERLECDNNQLNSLDISQNPILWNLDCSENQISHLDLSQNTALRVIKCQNNLLSVVDLRNGTNINIYSEDFRGNPNLLCVSVDDPNYSTADWWQIDPQTSFNTDCNQYEITDLAIDNCYLAASIEISVSAGNNNSYLDVLDTNGKIVCSINANGNNLGLTDFNVFVSSAMRNASGEAYMSRDIDISPEFQPTTPVDVIFYYTKSEIDELVMANTSINDENDLFYTKTADGCDATFNGSGVSLGKDFNSKYGILQEDIAVKLSTSSFSTFYAHGSGLLPVELSYFEVKKKEHDVLLTWETSSEINNAGFEIQRSQDAISWLAIGFEDGLGYSNESIQYTFTDRHANKGNNYYRLKQIDLDDEFKYSEIKVANFSNETKRVVFPNPTRGNLTIGQFATYELYDMQGALLMSEQSQQINISHFPAGVYMLRVVKEDASESIIKKVVLQK